jgi:putative ABC transport system permease protein
VRSPLLLAATTAWLRQGVWAVLVFAAFAVAALAAASAPMFTEASGNAVFADRRAAVAPNAAQGDDAVVRLTASASPRSADQERAVRELRAIPNLTAPRLGGSSVGAELTLPRPWESAVGMGGRRAPVRLFAVEDPTTRLVPAGEAGAEGAWLPQPVADDIGARSGDTIAFSVTTGGLERVAEVRVAGVYVTSGRLPADPAGGRSWSAQRADLPAEPGARTLSGYLLVADVATIERLAEETGDRVLWWADADLAPGTTLAGARRTARDVEELRLRYARILSGEPNAVVSPRVASGIGRIVGDATAVTAVVDRRTRTVEAAAIVVGLVSVLAVALLSVRRRQVELWHGVGAGISPSTVGALWFVEHLGPAILAGATGWAAAWWLVWGLGPPGEISAASLTPALAAAGLAALAGPLVAALAAGLASARRVRPSAPAVPSRPRPWALLVVVAAAVAIVGLWGTTQPRGIDLAVPLLVLAALGVLGGSALVRLASAGRRRPADPADSPQSARRRFVVAWLVRRRVAAGGERALTVMVLTAGFGMLAFGLCAVDSVAVNTADRVAVAAGAEAVAQIDGGSYLFDPDAVTVPPDPEPPGTRSPEGLVPGGRTPPLPDHATFVWRIDADTPLGYGTRDLVVVNPEQLIRVALWGRGADLAAARRALRRIGAVDPATAVPDRPIPAIIVGDEEVAGATDVPVDLGEWNGQLKVVAHIPAFPGLGLGNRPLYVVPDIVTFTHLGYLDPRLRPRSGSVLPRPQVRTYVWTSAGARGVAEVLGGRNLEPARVDTATQARQRPTAVAAAQARGYQLAVAAYLALLAAVALGVYSERSASAGRSGDLMLARVGLGRARVVRARTAELVTLVVVSLACVATGLAVLAPLASRLLDDDPKLVPVLRFTVPALAWTVTAAVAVAATAVASAIAALRARTREEEAYRDDA